MPKVADSTKELESVELGEPSPWLTAYAQVAGELEEGEITVRGLAKLLIEGGKKSVTLDTAKGALERMCKQGLAVYVGKKVVRQEGFRPSTVSVYRLINANAKS